MLFHNSWKNFKYATNDALKVYNLISQHIQVKNCTVQ